MAIQGERGSNSHMAALEMLGAVDLVPCSLSADVFDRLLDGSVDAAVLPIENSLHGSVAEHYDLLLQHPVRITAESLLRIRFHLIAMPGVAPPISAASSRIPWPWRSAGASSPSTASSRPSPSTTPPAASST